MNYAMPDASLTFTRLAAPTESRANVLGVGVHAIDLPTRQALSNVLSGRQRRDMCVLLACTV